MSKEAIKKAADAHVDLIPEPYNELYMALGFDNFKLLFDHFGGQSIYVPSMRSVLSDAIKSQVLAECERRTMTREQIARMYGYTNRYLRKLLDSS